jgi:LuxR family maltose regulon positive regulatory protein
MIQASGARKLTTVVAPAGFGKTTLLAEWIAGMPGGKKAVGWVSLDQGDNDPAVFWAYFIKAVQKVQPGVGARGLSQLLSQDAPAVESVVAGLINEISALDSDLSVVLDDYHVIESPAIHAAMTFLLERLPERMHVVVASRVEPPLALARLRARDELTELRHSDLRFTLDEASAFFNKAMALGLTPQDTATLERRTEGWIAGLKLAALSMTRRGDVRGFVDDFSGGNRYVADYLVEEVLRSEPEGVRRFLLGTAILDRLSAPLCDAVMGAGGSQAMLDDLERRNLFVVALDDRREWYRYHHLFAEVLQAQAAKQGAGGASECHLRASAWYEEHGLAANAVRHAVAAGDLDRAAALLERARPEMDRSYSSRHWLDRVKALPPHVVRARPRLTMGFAWGLLNSGELEAADALLKEVEQWLSANTDAMLSTELTSARVYLAQSRGEVPGTLEHAERALALAPEGDLAARATGVALVALAHWGRGDLDVAHRTFSEALDLMRQGGSILSAIRGIFVLGDIRVSQGRLREAADTYRQGLKLAAEQGPGVAPETDELNLGMAELHREWNDLDASVGFLDVITRTAASTVHKGNQLRWCAAMARVHEARGDFAGAFDLLEEAERHERRDPIPRVRPIDAMKVRVRVAQGRFKDVMPWAGGIRKSLDDPGYLREFEHVTFVRVLIAAGDEPSLTEAARLLDRLRREAETGGRAGSVIEMLVLESLAQHARANLRAALDLLGEALSRAEPEGYLRIFLDEGPRMRELLRHATTRGLAGEYTRHVLASFDETRRPARPAAALAPAVPGPSLQALTTRELEILRLIAAGMRNQEIADHLAISAATVKRHIANAYAKLGAGHRTEALIRANELKLL